MCSRTNCLLYITLVLGCGSEQDAAQVLGYTQASWDNLSGREQQPWTSIKSWFSLTANEKAAAEVLGYNETTWDDKSGSQAQPASALKIWDELTACPTGNVHYSAVFVGILPQ